MGASLHCPDAVRMLKKFLFSSPDVILLQSMRLATFQRSTLSVALHSFLGGKPKRLRFVETRSKDCETVLRQKWLPGTVHFTDVYFICIAIHEVIKSY